MKQPEISFHRQLRPFDFVTSLESEMRFRWYEGILLRGKLEWQTFTFIESKCRAAVYIRAFRKENQQLFRKAFVKLPNLNDWASTLLASQSLPIGNQIIAQLREMETLLKVAAIGIRSPEGRGFLPPGQRNLMASDLLLVLSENSMKSEWVMTEIRRARKVEREQNRRKLFPIRLVDFETIQKWECFDADSGKDLAVELRKYYIPDFSNWKDHDAFESEFAKLLRDLKPTEA